MGNQRKISGIQLFAQLQDGPITDVYKGYQESLQRHVLVKVLRPEYENERPLVERFLNEARGIARIQHPNVVAIYEHGEFGGRHYFASEFVDGQDLERVLLHQSLPPELAWYILSEVTKGLQAAHRKNVIHRDIKPSNILISNGGDVKLTDFGMSDLGGTFAEATKEETKGTEPYFAPEMILGEQVGPWSDIFSLGTTFYEMLAGIKPFLGDSAGTLFKAIVEEDPIPYLYSIRSLPPAFVALCGKMLDKRTEFRARSCEELQDQLESIRIESGFDMTQKELAAFLQSPSEYTAYDFTNPVHAPGRPKQAYSFVAAAALIILILLGWQFGSMSRSEKNIGPAPKEALGESEPESVSFEQLAKAADQQTSERPGVLPNATSDVGQTPAANKQEIPDEMQPEENLIAPQEISAGLQQISEGWLRVDCTPWAAVFIESDSIGTTPLSQKIKLESGTYHIVLKNPEFPIVRKTVTIAPDSTTALTVSLLKLVASLTLDIHPWAEVYIDGEYMDTLPPQKRPFFLSQGEHILQLRHPTLGQWQTSIRLDAGQSKEFRYNLINLLKK